MPRTKHLTSILRFIIFINICYIGNIAHSYGQFRRPPTMDQPDDMILLRNSPQQNVSLTGISDNSFFSVQTITFQGFSSDNDIIDQDNFTFIYTQGSSQGNFYFTPETNKSGLVTIEIELTDPNGSTSYFFDVLINSPPSFEITSSHAIDKNAGPQTIQNFAYNISDGDDDDGSQTLTFDVELDQVISGNITFSSAPEIDNQGTLTYAVNNGKDGEASFLVTLDDGQDGNNTSNTLSFNIIVSDYVNTPPTFSLSGDVEEPEDFTETQSVTATPDPVPNGEQDQEVTYSIVPESVEFAGISFDPTTGNVLINSLENRFGEQTFTITADDGEPENNTHSEEFTLTINNVDDPPTMDDIDDVFLPENPGEQQITLTGLSAGPYEPQQITNIIATSFDPSNIPDPEVEYTAPDTEGTLTFTPNENAVGETTIQVVVVDQGGKTLTKTFVVTIEEKNDPPYFNPITSPINLIEDDGDQIIAITGINAGPGENQSLSFDMTTGHDNLINNISIEYTSPETEGQLSFSLIPNANGTVILNLILSDDGPSGGIHQNSYSQEIEINVEPINDLPHFTSEPATNATTGEMYFYAIMAEDPDAGDNLTISPIQIPAWLTLEDNNDGTASLSGTPSEADLGENLVEIQVSDQDGEMEIQSFSIQVSNPNNLPVFTSEPVTEAIEKVFYEYNIVVDDADPNDDIVISALTKPSWLVLIDNGNRTAQLEGTPPSGSQGTYSVELRATDSEGDFAEQNFAINVIPFNNLPKLKNLQQTTKEDNPINYSVNFFKSGFQDDDGDTLNHIIITSPPENGKLISEDAVMQTNDTVDYNSMASLKYIPDPNFNGIDFFGWNGSDGKGYALNDALITITITSELDPPVLEHLEASDIFYSFGQDSVFLTNQIEVFEYDNGRLESASISISENFAPGVDSLAAPSLGNTRVNFDGQNGVLIIEGIDSVHVYQEILRSAIYYNKRNQSPNPAMPRKISFRVRDNEQFSNILTRSIEFEENFVELNIPNGFTPNNDMTNDSWNIQNIELYPDVKVEVYARNGNKVFESTGYQTEWNGTSSGGEELPSGVYYYFINLNKYQATYKGTITILK